MINDSVWERQKQLPVPSQQQVEEVLWHRCQSVMQPKPRRGRPAELVATHLCLGIVIMGLRGWGTQLGLWRLLCLEHLGPFAPVQVTDQAVYNRLQRAAGLMAIFFAQISVWMQTQLAGWQDQRLAPFASRVLALDESTLDVVGRWLPRLRVL
jgi:hypothetical protein